MEKIRLMRTQNLKCIGTAIIDIPNIKWHSNIRTRQNSKAQVLLYMGMCAIVSNYNVQPNWGLGNSKCSVVFG